MATIKRKGEKGGYDVLNKACLGCICLALGNYESRGATLSGSRNTGNFTKCCMSRAYHGCPDEDKREFSEERRTSPTTR